MSPNSSPVLPPVKRLRRTPVEKVLRLSTTNAEHIEKAGRAKIWTEEENQLLLDCVKEGWGWQRISREKLHGRSSDSCRKHYVKLLEGGLDILDQPARNSKELTASSLSSPRSSPGSERVADSQDRCEVLTELPLNTHEERHGNTSPPCSTQFQDTQYQNPETQSQITDPQDDPPCDIPGPLPLLENINDVILEINERKRRIDDMDNYLERTKEEVEALQKCIDSTSQQRGREKHAQKLALARAFGLISHIAGIDEDSDA